MLITDMVKRWLEYTGLKNPHTVTTTQLNIYTKAEIKGKTDLLVKQKYMPFFYFSRNYPVPSGGCSGGVLNIGQGYGEYNTVEYEVPALSVPIPGATTGTVYLAVTDDGLTYTLGTSGYKNSMKIGTFDTSTGKVTLYRGRKIAATEIEVA